jgi:transcriptional regulator with XRE-family HTH domain
MSLGQNIKALREAKGLLQKQVATEVGLGISHYSKIENDQREASVDMLDKLSRFYNTTIDKIVHPDNMIPEEVVIEDKNTIEQMQLIQELEEEDKAIIFKMIDKMLTTKKFKDFFNKNISAL